MSAPFEIFTLAETFQIRAKFELLMHYYSSEIKFVEESIKMKIPALKNYLIFVSFIHSSKISFSSQRFPTLSNILFTVSP